MNKNLKKLFIEVSLFIGIISAIVIALSFFRTSLFYERNLITLWDFNLYRGIDKFLFIESVLFVIVAFILFNRNEFKDFKEVKAKKYEKILFLILSLSSLFLYYYLKYWINKNLEFALQHTLFIGLLKICFQLLFIIFLWLTISGLKFTINFIKKFRYHIIVFSIVGALYFYLIILFQSLWKFFSTIVTKILYYIFTLTHDKVIINLLQEEPILGVNNFIVKIGKPCSGIDSMLLFSSLFILIFILDRKRINKKIMLLLFLPGLIGIFLFNILRVYLLMLIGIHFSQDFAIGLFHQNIGWILFIIYFIGFYYLVKRHIYVTP